ncbi:MAG: hypothetical protein JWO67_5611 [Streptosporangiaceae bacterium]|nr:hypothetical protein [Streptosporangiaceae bacterium]
MTTPQDPDRPHRPTGPGRPPGPYDPRQNPTGPGPVPDPGPYPGGPSGPRMGQPSQGWVPQPGAAERDYSGKGFLAALLDTNFEHLITPKLIKLFYTLSLVLITLSALIMIAFGVWVFQYGWVLGLMAFVFTPLIWLFEVVLVRIFMEAVIVRFKGVEHLRALKEREPKRS